MSWWSTMVRATAKAKGIAILNNWLRYNPLYYRSTRTMLQQFESLNRTQRQQMSDRLVRRALSWAKPAGGGRGQTTDITSWPVLEKSELRDHGADFVRRRFVSIPAATGGTTGLPVRLWRSLQNIAVEQAFIDHSLAATGHSFQTARIAVLRGDNVKLPGDREPPFGKLVQNGRQLVLSSQHLGPDTVSWYVDALAHFAADILWIYPSTGESLARNMAAQELELAIPVIFSSSEVLQTPARIFMAKVFGAQIIDRYGLAERVASAVSHRADEYFFEPVYGHIELQPVPDDATSHTSTAEIIATGLWNKAMPLVRYRTGDRVIYPTNYSTDDLAMVSLGLKPVLGIAGRDSDYLVSPRGEILVGIDHLPREIENILRLQIIQEDPHTVCIKALTTPGFSPEDRQHLMENARLKLPADMAVRIEEVAELARLPSGKAPFVIRR